MVKFVFSVGLIVLLAFFAVHCVKRLIELYYKCKALRYEQKHPGSLPRSGAGIVFNKETGKVEATPGQPILPFD